MSISRSWILFPVSGPLSGSSSAGSSFTTTFCFFRSDGASDAGVLLCVIFTDGTIGALGGGLRSTLSGGIGSSPSPISASCRGSRSGPPAGSAPGIGPSGSPLLGFGTGFFCLAFLWSFILGFTVAGIACAGSSSLVSPAVRSKIGTVTSFPMNESSFVGCKPASSFMSKRMCPLSGSVGSDRSLRPSGLLVSLVSIFLSWRPNSKNLIFFTENRTGIFPSGFDTIVVVVGGVVGMNTLTCHLRSLVCPLANFMRTLQRSHLK